MEEDKQVSRNQFWTGFLGGVAIVSVIGLVILGVAYVSKDNNNSGEVAGEQAAPEAPAQNQAAGQMELPQGLKWAAGEGISTFLELEAAEICQQDGVPMVFLFTTTWCPHCSWVKDTFDTTMRELESQGKVKAFHYEVDTGDDTITEAVESEVPADHLAIFSQFNPEGSIPTFVFGCKYFRIGNGHERQDDLAAEAKEFESLVDLMQ